MYTIYLVTNKVNGKVYVGQTSKSIAERLYEHIRLHSNSRFSKTYFYKAIRKHGSQAFEIKELARCGTLQEAHQLEQNYIQLFNSADAEVGYNTTLGGEGVRHNEATKEKLRKANSGKKHSPETRKKIGDIQRGRKRGALARETCEKISKALTGKKWTPEQRNKIMEHIRLHGSPTKGTHRSEETKRRASESMKKAYAKRLEENPNLINELIARNKRPVSEESRQRMRDSRNRYVAKKRELEETLLAVA